MLQERISRRLDWQEIAFDVDRALRFAGVPRRSRGYARAADLTAQLVERHGAVFQPAYRLGICSVHPVEGKTNGVEVDGVEVDAPGLVRRLERCERVALYVLTLGPDVDTLLAEMRSADFSEGFLLDAAASAYVHGLRLRLEVEAGALAATSGCTLTPRHAPGFHGWDLSGQEALFRLVDAGDLGLRLNESYLMIPQKSESGAYGFRPVQTAPAQGEGDAC